MKFAHKKKIIILSLCLAVVGILFIFRGVLALSFTDVVYFTIGNIIQMFVWLGGQLLSIFVTVLVWVAAYNDFVSPVAIVQGWTVVRDLTNMFFILVLLVIAFATILRIESYQYKKLLPRLLIIAIVINFSKTIAGLIIDFGQVVMLTFVNAFASAAGGNFIVGFGINKLLSIRPATESAAKTTANIVIINYILALIYVVVAIITIVTMVAVLVFRIIMLWLLIVLSPLAFFLSTFPQGQEYSKMWWKEFSSAVIIGPVLAFFIWLSLVAFTPINNGQTSELKAKTVQGNPVAGQDLKKIQAGNGAMGDAESMIAFVMAIGMLWGGLYIAQKVGGATSKVAGKGFDKAVRYGLAPVTRPAGALARKTKDWAGEKVTNARYKLAGITGFATFLPSEDKKKMKERGTSLWRDKQKTALRDVAAGHAAAANVTGSRLRYAMALAGSYEDYNRMGKVKSWKAIVGIGKHSREERKAMGDRLEGAVSRRRRAESMRLAAADPDEALESEMSSLKNRADIKSGLITKQLKDIETEKNADKSKRKELAAKVTISSGDLTKAQRELKSLEKKLTLKTEFAGQFSAIDKVKPADIPESEMEIERDTHRDLADKSLDSDDLTRRIVDKWNKKDGKNYFEDPERLSRAKAVAADLWGDRQTAEGRQRELSGNLPELESKKEEAEKELAAHNSKSQEREQRKNILDKELKNNERLSKRASEVLAMEPGKERSEKARNLGVSLNGIIEISTNIDKLTADPNLALTMNNDTLSQAAKAMSPEDLKELWQKASDEVKRKVRLAAGEAFKEPTV